MMVTNKERAQVIDALAATWKANPNLRLGQLLINVAGAENDLFYIEDEALQGRLERYTTVSK